MRGFGATTAVAWLLIFWGADPPSRSLGFRCRCWRGGGGGGGGDRPMSKMLIGSSGIASGIFPDRLRNASSSRM